MQTGFTRKKVESLTLGERLRKLRSDFRMSLSEISKTTKIQVKYLEYLENGEYEKLPADVYVRGFLRSYARYLNVDEQALIKLYERERHIRENLGHENPKSFQTKGVSISSVVITPRSLMIAMIVVLVVGAFAYLYREFRSFAAAPRLVLLEPSNGAVIEASETVVRGKTDKGARVFINNQPVFVSGEGDFTDKLLLKPGLNTITVLSINRFDAERSETMSLEARYTPEAANADISQPISSPETEFALTVTVYEKNIHVTVMEDDTVVWNGVMEPGKQKSFRGSKQIIISSENGNQTFVSVNGQAEERLTPSAEAVKSMVFTAAGKQEGKPVY